MLRSRCLRQLGLEWGDKKTICNKYPQSSPVTCVTWPAEHPNEVRARAAVAAAARLMAALGLQVVFGLAEGKVKIGLLKEQKPAATLYATGSLVTSICSSPDGNAVVSAHQDGTMYRFLFQDHAGRPSYARFAVHSVRLCAHARTRAPPHAPCGCAVCAYVRVVGRERGGSRRGRQRYGRGPGARRRC